MFECGYIGRSDIMVRAIIENKAIHLTNLIVDHEPTQEMKNLILEYNLSFEIVNNKHQLQEAVASSGTKKYIMYVCGIIVPEDIIEEVDIYNFHPGSIENNRGATPIIRSILRGDYYSCMSVFKINGGIDTGEIVTRSMVKIEQMDDSITLKKKLEDTIPLLLDNIAHNNFQIDTFYCEKVNQNDYSIGLNEHSIEDVEKIVKSQKIYNGANIDGQTITDIEVKKYEWEKKEEIEDYIEYEIKAKVRMKKSGEFKEKMMWHKRPDGGWNTKL